MANAPFSLGNLGAPVAPPVLPQQMPLLQQQPQSLLPGQGQPAALTPDQLSLATMANPVAAGGAAGFKAPRGLEHVRSKIGINQYGERVIRNSGRSRGYNSGYNSRSYNSRSYNSRSYNSRSYNSRSYSRSNGFAPTFGVGAAVKSSLIWGGAISLLINGYQYFNKQETGATATTNVASDLVSSAVGGAAGAMASWAGAGMLASLGVSGMALSLAGIGIGIAGFMCADFMLRQTPLFKNFQNGVYKLFGGT